MAECSLREPCVAGQVASTPGTWASRGTRGEVSLTWDETGPWEHGLGCSNHRSGG